MISRNIQIKLFGKPEEVAECINETCRTPDAGELQISIKFAPINPADVNVMEGTYGKIPPLPTTIGNEAVGVVNAIGTGVTGWEIGDNVLPLKEIGLWAEQLNIAASHCVKLPKEIELSQAAMLRVNPASAWLLLTEFVKLNPGDWVVQNAANSALGLSVIQLAREQGWKTLNLVRREEAADICRNAGAEFVLVEDDPEFKSKAAEILGSSKAKLALNAVGGESALRLAGLLADRGTHVTFGAMGRQKLSLPNRFLIFQELTFTGFWMNQWAKRNGEEKLREVYELIAQKFASGVLKLPIAATYAPEQINQAVRHAQEGKRTGKVMLKW